MSFSFFGLFGQTGKFKTVGVTEFAKAVADTSYVVLDVRTPAQRMTYLPLPLQTQSRRLS